VRIAVVAKVHNLIADEDQELIRFEYRRAITSDGKSDPLQAGLQGWEARYEIVDESSVTHRIMEGLPVTRERPVARPRCPPRSGPFSTRLQFMKRRFRVN